MAEGNQLEAMFDSVRRHGLHIIGRLSQRPELRVFADPTCCLFNRHLAILGQSGSGQVLGGEQPAAAHCQVDAQGAYRCSICMASTAGVMPGGAFTAPFPATWCDMSMPARLGDPHWLLTYCELSICWSTVQIGMPRCRSQFMREVLHTLRKKGNSIRIDRLSRTRWRISPARATCTSRLRLHNEQQFDWQDEGLLFGAFDEFPGALPRRCSMTRATIFVPTSCA